MISIVRNRACFVSIAATDMVPYTNTVRGLSFDYPRELGEATFDDEAYPSIPGASRQVGFERFDALKVAGVSPDFGPGRGGMDEDTLGFSHGSDGSRRPPVHRAPTRAST